MLKPLHIAWKGKAKGGERTREWENVERRGVIFPQVSTDEERFKWEIEEESDAVSFFHKIKIPW